MNKRIEEIEKEIQRLESWKRKIIDDLAIREEKETFQEAMRLFKTGYRLTGWGLPLSDTNNETILTRSGETIGYWSDGSNRDSEEAFERLSLSPDNPDEILRYLNDLTLEEMKTIVVTPFQFESN